MADAFYTDLGIDVQVVTTNEDAQLIAVRQCRTQWVDTMPFIANPQ